jgi:hypothetical protein
MAPDLTSFSVPPINGELGWELGVRWGGHSGQPERGTIYNIEGHNSRYRNRKRTSGNSISVTGGSPDCPSAQSNMLPSRPSAKLFQSATGDLQGCEQAGGPMAGVVVGHARRQSGPHRQHRLAAVKRLNLRLMNMARTPPTFSSLFREDWLTDRNAAGVSY